LRNVTFSVLAYSTDQSKSLNDLHAAPATFRIHSDQNVTPIKAAPRPMC